MPSEPMNETNGHSTGQLPSIGIGRNRLGVLESVRRVSTTRSLIKGVSFTVERIDEGKASYNSSEHRIIEVEEADTPAQTPAKE